MLHRAVLHDQAPAPPDPLALATGIKPGGKGGTGGGTGLGLSLAYQIVERAGGVMDIKSLLGTGTTITLVLPAARAVEAGTAVEGRT